MVDTDKILRLAAIIREIDGNHSKGAAALAESILDHPDFRAALGEVDEPTVPEGREPVSVIGEPSDEDLLGIACQSIEPYDKIRPGEYEAETECAIEVYGSELVTFARAVLTRWGNPAPQLSDEEIIAFWSNHCAGDGDAGIIRLARWGNPAPKPPAKGEVVECTAELEEQKPRPDYDRVQKIATEAQIRSAAQYLAKKQHCDGDLIPAIRYAIARWGHQPAPPADGEVAELVQHLHHAAEVDDWDGASPEWCQSMLRAADLLQRLSPPQPVPVSERLPEPSTKVLAHYFNDLGKGRTICAIWVPAKTQTDSYGEDDFTEYDEETDNFYWPEGWYEAIENWDDFGWVKVNEGKVVYWQPLPKWPAHTLPLPGQEADLP